MVTATTPPTYHLCSYKVRTGEQEYIVYELRQDLTEDTYTREVLEFCLETRGEQLNKRELEERLEDVEKNGFSEWAYDGVILTAGIRNSTDKSFSLGFCCGERVMVCSNLCFGSEITISRKHTANAEDDFLGQVIKAGMQLRKYRDLSEERIAALHGAHLNDDEADALMLRAFEQGVVGSRMLPKLISEWREPSFTEFEDRNRFSMLNCYTGIMRDRFEKLPYQAAAETMRFQQFLSEASHEYAQSP